MIRCGCGLYGEGKRISPWIMHGGSTKASVWLVSSKNSNTKHKVSYVWNEQGREYSSICLGPLNK